MANVSLLNLLRLVSLKGRDPPSQVFAFHPFHSLPSWCVSGRGRAQKMVLQRLGGERDRLSPLDLGREEDPKLLKKCTTGLTSP